MVTEDTTRLGTEGEEQARDSDVGVAKGLGRLSLSSSLFGSSPALVLLSMDQSCSARDTKIRCP